MDNNSLTHWGVRGMKWGIRRYQNKDGSLTAAGKKRRGADDGAAEKNESDEEKRARVLKSTNAAEIYKNRNLLTTAEINERLNRIDTERRLSEAASRETASRDAKPKKTAIDRVDTVLKYGRKANEVYQFMDTPLMKAIKGKILGEKAKNYAMPLDKIWKMKDTLPTEELSKAVKRANLEKTIKKALDDVAEAKAKTDAEMKTAKPKAEEPKATESKTEDSKDRRQTNNKSSDENKVFTGKVVGEGTSKYDFGKQNDDIIIDVDYYDTPVSSNSKSSSTYALGYSKITGLLEDKSRRWE